MASSVTVSSERAFSSAGITISKRRNRLKADIVEALQFLKCSYRHDLVFREVDDIVPELVSAMSEEAAVSIANATGRPELADHGFKAWDELLEDDENEADLGNGNESDIDIGIVDIMDSNTQ